jgi:hypothetical protein
MSATPLAELSQGRKSICPWCYDNIVPGQRITLVLSPLDTYLYRDDPEYMYTDGKYELTPKSAAGATIHADMDWSHQTAYHINCYAQMQERVVEAPPSDVMLVAEALYDEAGQPSLFDISIDVGKYPTNRTEILSQYKAECVVTVPQGMLIEEAIRTTTTYQNIAEDPGSDEPYFITEETREELDLSNHPALGALGRVDMNSSISGSDPIALAQRIDDKWRKARAALNQEVLAWVIEQLDIDGEPAQVKEIFDELIERAEQSRRNDARTA